MNIKNLKNEHFINFATKVVGYRVDKVRPTLTRSSDIVVLEFSLPDSGFAQTEYEKFTFSAKSCVRKSNIVGVINLTEKWHNHVDELMANENKENTAGI